MAWSVSGSKPSAPEEILDLLRRTPADDVRRWALECVERVLAREADRLPEVVVKSMPKLREAALGGDGEAFAVVVKELARVRWPKRAPPWHPDQRAALDALVRALARPCLVQVRRFDGRMEPRDDPRPAAAVAATRAAEAAGELVMSLDSWRRADARDEERAWQVARLRPLAVLREP